MSYIYIYLHSFCVFLGSGDLTNLDKKIIVEDCKTAEMLYVTKKSCHDVMASNLCTLILCFGIRDYKLHRNESKICSNIVFSHSYRLKCVVFVIRHFEDVTTSWADIITWRILHHSVLKSYLGNVTKGFHVALSVQKWRAKTLWGSKIPPSKLRVLVILNYLQYLHLFSRC